MPIYEYECRACGHEFERLVRTGDTPSCPACESQDLERLLSLLTISSESIRRTNIEKARHAYKKVAKDKAVADFEEVKEHYGESAQEAMRKMGPLRPAKSKPKA
jgi:putative FmdB family regulatory protein